MLVQPPIACVNYSGHRLAMNYYYACAVDPLKMLPFRICHGIWEVTENQVQKEHARVRTRYRRSSTRVH